MSLKNADTHGTAVGEVGGVEDNDRPETEIVGRRDSYLIEVSATGTGGRGSDTAGEENMRTESRL